MSVLDIVLWPDAGLSTQCVPVDAITPELEQLIADMFDTMYAAQGRGLAAPQVGRTERIFVFDANWKSGVPSPVVCVNPEILSVSEQRVEGEEACLSIPGVPMKIYRASEVTLRWTDTRGMHTESFSGAEAVIVQHENDHLDGIVIYDRQAQGGVQ
tara:strand:- start:20596 stop:21063 length:468 start_codon:yes stop_codon:yes gene_type:complete